MPSLSPTQAANLARLARRHVIAGALRPAQSDVFTYLLWTQRMPGWDRVMVSYSTMQAHTHMRREDLVETVRVLERLGLIAKIKSWCWVQWQGLRVRRQAKNVYVFRRDAPESERRTVYGEARKTRPCPYVQAGGLQPRVAGAPEQGTVLSALEAALARIAQARGFTMPGLPK